MKKKQAVFLSIFLITLGIFFLFERKTEIKEAKNNKNIELAIYINEEETNTIPSKDSGYYYDREKSSCTNEVYINWDSISWSPVVNNMNEYKTRCELHFTTTYTEGILNGTDPVLKDELVPVIIEDNGTVKKANLESEWYSYEKKNWANAVILFDETQNSNYKIGDTIPENAIESYFVWIPKYRYQLWDLGLYDSVTTIDTSKVHEIPIIFGDYNTSDEMDGECTTPMESGATGNCKVGDYMTHPAFLSIPSTGFWVGKFETGYNGATSTEEAEQNVNDSSKVIIKSNVYSSQGIQISNAFYTSYNYKRELDSHMMKNTEWGAVAYLQHSAYGSSTSVRFNNNSNLVTGYSANNEPTCGATETNEECNRYCNDGTCNTAYPNSVLASTTGNISGIYDMSGGAWEYVMGVMLNQNGVPVSGRNALYNSGFNGPYTEGGSNTTGVDFPGEKYYDTYEYTAVERYEKRVLGDATGEVGPFGIATYNSKIRTINSWYNDGFGSSNSVSPWIMRGSHALNGSESGLFCSGGTSAAGGVNNDVGFRITLSVYK